MHTLKFATFSRFRSVSIAGFSILSLTIKGDEVATIKARMSGKAEQAAAQGAIKAEGRASAVAELLNLTTTPEFWFPIVTRPAWKG